MARVMAVGVEVKMAVGIWYVCPTVMVVPYAGCAVFMHMMHPVLARSMTIHQPPWVIGNCAFSSHGLPFSQYFWEVLYVFVTSLVHRLAY